MRLSSFVLSLIFLSATAFAGHGGGGSAGGSSAGASASSVGASGFSVSSVSPSPAPAASGGSSHPSPSSHSPSPAGSARPQMTPGPSLLHPFRKAKPIENAQSTRREPCWKGNCQVCPPGQSLRGAACFTSANVCPAGQTWAGFGCAAQNYWYDDCYDLAQQLRTQQRISQGITDPGQALLVDMLRRQYDSCLSRGGYGAFGSFPFDYLSSLNLP